MVEIPPYKLTLSRGAFLYQASLMINRWAKGMNNNTKIKNLREAKRSIRYWVEKNISFRPRPRIQGREGRDRRVQEKRQEEGRGQHKQLVRET